MAGLLGSEKIELSEEALIEFVKKRDWVSVVEVMKRFNGTEGDLQFGLLDKNIVFWEGVSRELVDLLVRLRDEKKIYFHPGDVISYLTDGGGLTLPLAKRNHAYKKPHWLPIFFRVKP